MLADKIRLLREQAGLTQQEVATRAGLSWSMVAHIEQGRKPDLRISTLIRLSNALGVPPTDLFATFVEEGVQPRRKRGGGEQLHEKPERPGRPRGRPPAKAPRASEAEGQEGEGAHGDDARTKAKGGRSKKG